MTVAHARFLFAVSPKTSGKLPSLSASCRSSSWGSSRIHLPKGAVPFGLPPSQKEVLWQPRLLHFPGTSSGTPCGAFIGSVRMGRFDKLVMPRAQVDINLPGFDIRRSLVRANRLQDRRRKDATPAKAPSTEALSTAPDPEMVELGTPDQQEHPGGVPCHQFQIVL